MNIDLLIKGFITLFSQPELILWVIIGGQAGIIFGMMPGLTTTTALSLLTGLTFKLGPERAIAVLMGAFVGSVTGGSRSAILINIPGTPAQAAVCLDGYQLTRKGRAAEALGVSVTSSSIGTFFGMIMLGLFTPILGVFALRFGTWEFFWLATFGVVIAGGLTSPDDPWKGWIAGFFGLLIATVGQDGIQAYVRFTGGSFNLRAGFALIPVLIGAYGIPEVFKAIRKQERFTIMTEVGRVLPRFREVFAHWRHILRSGIIGTFIGIVPGVGSDLASWISYDTARRTSAHPEEFGKGSVEGLIAAEGGDNACIGGDIVPVLTLAIPGSAPAAVLLAALTIHGLQPGPLMVLQRPDAIGQIFAMGLVATAAVFVLSLVLVRQMVRILLIPRSVLMPIVFIIAVVGSFALSGRLFDVYVMAAFGLIGLAMQELGYPVAPFVLGFILGPMMEDNFRRGLELAAGSPLPFFTRPISIVLIALTLFSILSRTPFPSWMRRQVRSLRVAAEPR